MEFSLKKYLVVFVLFLIFFVWNPPEVKSSDFTSLDEIVQALYDCISFKENSKPNLDRYRTMFIPSAQFIRVSPDGIMNMDLEGFISFFEERIDSGAIKSFYEAETSRKTNTFKNIAQVYSAYRKAYNSDNPTEFSEGVNCMQLYFDGERWWVTSVVWEDE